MVVRRALTQDLSALARRSVDGLQIALLVGRAGVGKSTLAHDVATETGLPQIRLDLFPEDAESSGSSLRGLARKLGVPGSGDDHVVDDLLAALERKGPCLLLVEDVQWMDMISQRTIWQVLRRATELPVMLLMTSVDTSGPLAEGVALMLRTLERGRLVDVVPFSEAEVREYVHEEFRIELGAETLHRVYESTDGVPALLASVVQQLRMSGSVDLDRALRSIVDRSRSSGLLVQQVGRVMDDASPQLRAALIALSLAGRLTADQLTRVLDLQGLPDVSTHELLATTLVNSDDEYALRLGHPQYPSPLLAYATGADRRDAHLALGRVLRGVDSLEHRAAVVTPRTAPELLQEIDDRLHDAYAQVDLELACRLARIGARIDEGYAIEVVLAALRNRRPQLLQDLRDRFVDIRPSVTRTVGLAVIEDDIESLRGASRRLARIDPCEITDVRELLALAYAFQYIALRLVAEVIPFAVPAARRLIDEMATRQTEIADIDPTWGRELETLQLGLQLFVAAGDFEFPTGVRLRHLDELRERFESSSRSETMSTTIAAMKGIIHHLHGDLGSARTELQHALAGRTLAGPDLSMQAASALIDIEFLRGAWDTAHLRAHRQLTAVLDVMRPAQWGRPFVLASLVPACRGDESLITSSSLTEDIIEADHVSLAAKAQWTAWRSIAVGGPSGTAGAALDALADSGRGLGPGAYLLTVLRVRDHLAAGARHRAVDALDAFADEDFAPHAIAYARHHVDALLAADVRDHGAAERAFTAAAEEYEAYIAENPSAPPRMYGAVLAEDWARHRARLGEGTPSPLAALLADAVALTGTCGADLWCDRLRALHERIEPETPLLHAPGGDPLSALTAREREVVTLAAGGLSNRDISRALFVTVRTAEYHVHNALTKLGLSSRAQLPEVIGEPQDSAA